MLSNEIQGDRMIGRRADRRWHACEHRRRRTMDMASCDKAYAPVSSDDSSEIVVVAKILHIHMPDAGDERWVMQKQ